MTIVGDLVQRKRMEADLYRRTGQGRVADRIQLEASTIEQLAAALEAMTKERDEALANQSANASGWRQMAFDAEAENKLLRAEVAFWKQTDDVCGEAMEKLVTLIEELVSNPPGIEPFMRGLVDLKTWWIERSASIRDTKDIA